MLVLKSSAPLSVERTEIKLSSESGYSIKPGRDPEKPGDLYWVQVVGFGVSKWVQSAQNVDIAGCRVVYLQADVGTTKSGKYCVVPRVLAAVDMKGDGKDIVTVTPWMHLKPFGDDAKTPGDTPAAAAQAQASTPQPAQRAGRAA